AIKTSDGPLVVVGGSFGLEVWEIQSARRLAFHPWQVEALAVGEVKGRPLVVVGHVDGSVAVHELPSLAVLAHDNSAHSGRVLVAAMGHGMVAATGDIEGTLVLWRLPVLEQIRRRVKAHTMVRGLATAELDGAPVLVSAGDTLKRDGLR